MTVCRCVSVCMTVCLHIQYACFRWNTVIQNGAASIQTDELWLWISSDPFGIPAAMRTWRYAWSDCYIIAYSSHSWHPAYHRSSSSWSMGWQPLQCRCPTQISSFVSTVLGLIQIIYSQVVQIFFAPFLDVIYPLHIRSSTSSLPIHDSQHHTFYFSPVLHSLYMSINQLEEKIPTESWWSSIISWIIQSLWSTTGV